MAKWICPVCGRRVDPNLAWERGLIAQYTGRTYYLCSPACQQEFAWNRHAYVLAHDLVCHREVDPEETEVAGLYADYQGIRYHFCSRECLQRFALDPEFYRDLRRRGAETAGQEGDSPLA